MLKKTRMTFSGLNSNYTFLARNVGETLKKWVEIASALEDTTSSRLGDDRVIFWELLLMSDITPPGKATLRDPLRASIRITDMSVLDRPDLLRGTVTIYVLPWGYHSVDHRELSLQDILPCLVEKLFPPNSAH